MRSASSDSTDRCVASSVLRSPPRASGFASSVTMTSTSPPEGTRVLAWAPASAGRQASTTTKRRVTRFRNDMVERKTTGGYNWSAARMWRNW